VDDRTEWRAEIAHESGLQGTLGRVVSYPCSSRVGTVYASVIAIVLAVTSTGANALSKILPPIFHVRVACSVTGTSSAAAGLTERRLCDEARSAIQELANGKIDPDIAQLNGWRNFANPDKQEELDECHKKIDAGGMGGLCAEDSYDLWYRGQRVPFMEIGGGSVRSIDPDGLTVVVAAAGGSAIDLTVTLIEPPVSRSAPEHQIDLPSVGVDGLEPLRLKLKLMLARYFTPEALNDIMGNAVRRGMKQ
jgi:hypothetical protein